VGAGVAGTPVSRKKLKSALVIFYGIVSSHLAKVFKAQDSRQVPLGAQGPIGILGLGCWYSKTIVEARQESPEYLIGILHSVGSGQAEFRH
jgi:hypothetical protein